MAKLTFEEDRNTIDNQLYEVRVLDEHGYQLATLNNVGKEWQLETSPESWPADELLQIANKLIEINNVAENQNPLASLRGYMG